MSSVEASKPERLEGVAETSHKWHQPHRGGDASAPLRSQPQPQAKRKFESVRDKENEGIIVSTAKRSKHVRQVIEIDDSSDEEEIVW